MGNKIIVSKHTSELNDLLKITDKEAEKLKQKIDKMDEQLLHLSLWEISIENDQEVIKSILIHEKIKEKMFQFNPDFAYLLLTIARNEDKQKIPLNQNLKFSSSFSKIFTSIDQLSPRGLQSPFYQSTMPHYSWKISLLKGENSSKQLSAFSVYKAVCLEKWMIHVREFGAGLIQNGYFVCGNKIKSGNLINLVSHKNMMELNSKTSSKVSMFFSQIFKSPSNVFKSVNYSKNTSKFNLDLFLNANSDETNLEGSLKFSTKKQEKINKTKKEANSEQVKSLILSDSNVGSNEGQKFETISEQKASRKFNLNLEMIRLTDSGESDSVLRETTRKLNRMEEFKDVCSDVFKGKLFLSGISVAQNLETLKRFNIRYILNCAGDYCQNKFKDNIKYKTYFIKDSKLENIECVFYESFQFIEHAIQKNENVLVHCVQGVSRSVTIVLAYLMLKLKITYVEAFERVKEIRGIASPNIGFIVQLMVFQKRLECSLEKGLIKIFCVGSHQIEDPKTIVARYVI